MAREKVPDSALSATNPLPLMDDGWLDGLHGLGPPRDGITGTGQWEHGQTSK